MAGTANKSILKATTHKVHFNLAHAMAWAKVTYGKGRYRQLWEMAKLALGKPKLEPRDYYAYGMFRPTISADDRKTYVSLASGQLLNKQLSPKSTLNQSNLLNDKLLLGYMLDAAGFPVLPIRALYSKQAELRNAPTLRSAEDIAAYLAQDGSLPCFGKPIFGSLGVGAASYIALENGGDDIRLGDERIVPLKALAAEIAEAHAAGYLFQELIKQHPVVEDVAGQTVTSLRLVTVRTEAGPELLYSVLKMPAKGAMIDAGVGPLSNGMALIDPLSGKILRAQEMSRLCTTPLHASLVTGKPFSHITLPYVGDATKIALQVHQIFAGHGVLGFDFALSETGPLINEINANPHHHAYQRAADRGVLNTDFLPKLQSAEREVTRVIAELEAGNIKRGFVKKRRTLSAPKRHS